MDGVLRRDVRLPLCVDKSVEVGNKIMRDKEFQPEKTTSCPRKPVTAENAKKRCMRGSVDDGP